MRPWRIILYVLLLAGAGASLWAWRYGKTWLDHQVRERLNEIIDRATVEGYRFQLDSVTTDAIAGDLTLANVRLDFDTALVDSLREGHYRYLFSARMDRLVLRGVSYWRLLLRSEFRIERLEVDGPALRYLVGHEHVGLNEPFGRLAAGKGPPIGLFRTDTLVVRHASCVVQDLSGRWPLMRIQGLDLTVEDLELKAQRAVHGMRVEAGAIALGLGSLSAELGSGYRVHLGAVRLTRGGTEGSIEALELTPPPASDTATAVTRTALHIPRIALRHIDLDRLIGDSGLRIAALEVQGMQVEAELDRTLPDPPGRPMQLPAAAVLQLGFPLHIDTLRVIGGNVHYHERAPTGRWGDVPFAALNATLTGISNEPTAHPPSIQGRITCMLADSGSVSADYEARMDGSDDFTFDATVTQLPFAALDRLTTPLLRLNAFGGHLRALRLHMKGDDGRAKGTVAMTYDGLLVRVVPGITSDQRHSLFGSIMDDVLRTENGGGLGGDRQRNVAIERDRERSLLTFIWHFTRAGLVRNITPAAIERVEQVVRHDKEVRRAERTLREQRRAARR